MESDTNPDTNPNTNPDTKINFVNDDITKNTKNCTCCKNPKIYFMDTDIESICMELSGNDIKMCKRNLLSPNIFSNTWTNTVAKASFKKIDF